MKKKLLLIIMCILGLFTVRAQETSFFYDFEDGTLNGWTVFQGEGATGNNWRVTADGDIYYAGQDNSKGIYSVSWDENSYMQFYPNNYVVTEQAYQITENSVLSWFMRYTYLQWGEFDKYEVVASEDGTNFDMVLWEGDGTSPNNNTLSLAEYAGKALYLGFRHYAESDPGDALVLDNIVLTDGEGGEEPTPKPEPVAPAAPTNVVATADGQNSIIVTWNAVEGATYYIVYKDGQMWDQVNGTTYTSTGLTAGTEYCYAVQAYDANDLESELSEEVCATTESLQENQVIVGTATTKFYSPFLTILQGADRWFEAIYRAEEIGKAGMIEQIAFSYNMGAQTTADIKIYFAEVEKTEFANPEDFTPATDLTLVYSGTGVTLCDSAWETFVLDTPFNYSGENNLLLVVTTANTGLANNWNCYIGDTNTVLIKELGFDTRKPVLMLTYAEGGETPEPEPEGDICTLVLTMTDSYGDGWNGNKLEVVYGATSKTIEFHDGATMTETMEIPSGTHVTVTYQKIGSYPEENSFVVAYESGKEILNVAQGSLSATTSWEFVVDCTPAVPETPVLAAEATSDTTIVLTWAAVEGATSYNVYSADTLVANVTETTYTVEGLTAETEYTFVVKAVNEVGESEASNVATAKTLAAAPVEPEPVAPAAPTNVVATADGQNSIIVTWNAVDGASEYNIYHNEELISETNTTSDTIEGLTESTEYCFAVTALFYIDVEDETYAFESELSETVCAITEEEIEVPEDPDLELPEYDFIVTIGSGDTMSSSLTPYYGYYEYSVSQQIYTAEEIGVDGGIIKSIAFKSASENTATRNISVFMKNTTKDYFESDTDWIGVSENDLVYEGPITTTGIHKWCGIELTEEFVYGGDNILLFVVDNTGQWSGEYDSFYIYFSSENTSLYHFRDVNSYDPYDLSVSASNILGEKNYVQFTFAGINGPMPTEFFYDFEDLSLEDWTTIDADGDGHQWLLDSTNSTLVSYSYNGDYLYPDNYIFTTSKYKITEMSNLSFSHTCADYAYNQDKFAVVISEDGINFNIVWEYLYTEDSNSDWENVTIDLSSYAGKALHIGFRHFDCNGEFGTGVRIDNIKLATEDIIIEPEPTAKAYRLESVGTAWGNTAYTYDEVNKNRVVSIDESGLITELEYNAEGQLVGAIASYEDVDEDTISVISYVYDEAGVMTSYTETSQSWFGTVETVNSFEYNAEGQLVRIAAEESKTEFAYNAEGLVSEKVFYYADTEEEEGEGTRGWEVNSKEAYVYEDGNLVKVEYYYVDWKTGDFYLAEKAVYKYDVKGNCVVREVYSVEGETETLYSAGKYYYNETIKAEDVYSFEYPHFAAMNPAKPAFVNIIAKELSYYSYYDEELGEVVEHSHEVKLYNYNPEVLSLPLQPMNLTAEVMSATEVELAWAGFPDAESFTLYQGEAVLAEGLVDPYYTVENLEMGVEYCFAVMATNSVGNSEVSETVCVTIGLPAAPVVTGSFEGDKVILEWEAVEGALAYNLYYGGNLLAGPFEDLVVEIQVPSPGEYCFTVTAVNEVGESEYSEEVCVYVPGPALTFSYNGNETTDAVNDIEFVRDINASYEIQFDLEISNNTANDMNVVCEVEDLSNIGQSYICWGNCYTPGTTMATNTVYAGGDAIFNGHAMFVDEEWNELPKGTVIPVRYTFYDESNPSEKYVFNVNFIYNTTRNVLIEEFTGKHCGYCPDGHRIANEIAAANPGKVFPINIHAGGFSPTDYPNLNTTDGNAIMNGLNVAVFPSGIVNRNSNSAIGRQEWGSRTNSELAQTAEVNISGNVAINSVTRQAEITVELDYLSNSNYSTNYLTIMMLQDSIFGSQSGATLNPSQVVNGQYCHMHVLRDVITNTWGDAITPTTAGTHITKKYIYEIPEVIGDPNGVEVDLDNIYFLAFVTEKQDGTPTRPVLNVNKLEKVNETPDTAILAAPTNLRATIRQDVPDYDYKFEITVAWDAVEGAKGYDVFVNTEKEQNYYMGYTNGTEYVMFANQETTFEFYVVAFNDETESEPSEVYTVNVVNDGSDPSSSLIFFYEGNEITNTVNEITLERDINESFEIQFDLVVGNNTANDMNVVCEKEDLSNVGQSYICWGSCYMPGTTMATNTVYAGGDAIFNGHAVFYDEDWNELPKGTVIPVRYTFYDESNPSEQYVFNVKFIYENDDTANYWTPDESLYANNMTIITTVEIDGEEQYNPNLELGAFCNGELRGSARLQYVDAPANRYECFLMVYGNSGDDITFRLYDHGTGLESDFRSSEVVDFEVNATIGDVTNPYTVNFIGSVIHSRDLTSGWNWYSTYIINEGAEGLTNLEAAVGTNGIQIKNQTKFVNQASGNWYGTLTSTAVEDMFMIQMSAAHTLNLEGYVVNPADHPITLGTNWKWISYPLSAEMSVEDAFASANPSNGDYVKSQKGFAQYYEGLGWSGTLKTMTPGMGYMYQNTSGYAKTLVYPMANAKSKAEAQVEEDLHWTADATKYPMNMTVIAVVEDAARDYEVAAFSNGECRGSARPVYIEALGQSMIFMTVYGDDNEAVSFRYYDVATGEEVNLNDEMTFEVNATHGDVMEPYVMTLSTMGIDEASAGFNIYPNPVHDKLYIETEAEVKEVVVYDVYGRLQDYMTTRQQACVEVDVTDLNSGVYFIQIKTEEGNITKRFVKE